MDGVAGYLRVGEARLWYEAAGVGTPIVMLHAGVADSRQWDREFRSFAGGYRVVRYDMRGFGHSEPVAGDYTNMADLTALMDHLRVREPAVLMGCSMGGGLAIEVALAHPQAVRALVLVGAGPSGLELDVPPLKQFAKAEAAYQAGDFDLLCELEMRVWFDGIGRGPGEVDAETRADAYAMNRLVLTHHATGLGTRQPDAATAAADRLGELTVPVLVVVGEYDIPYIHGAADHMVANLPDARKLVLQDAAHLANLQQPEAFEAAVRAFLAEVGVVATDVSGLSRDIHPMPDAVAAALTAKGLWAAYRGRPAYQQNDYLGWINRAKRQSTRDRRLAQMLAELEAGGVYMGMDV